MQGLRAGKRYAKALMKLSEEQNSLEKIHGDIQTLEQALKNSPELRSLLQSPVVKTEKKKEILSLIFKGKISELSLKFILMLAGQKREAALESVIENFIAQYNEKNNIASVQVATAVPLSDELRGQLLDKIKKAYNFSSVDLRESVDENLIGGLLIRIGDKQLDESIRRKIKDVHQELLNA